MNGVVCGLDVHKDSTYATILNSEGKIINQMRMTNEKVFSYLSHFKVSKVAMESSTSVASLYMQLAGEGFDVVVSQPKKTRYIAEAMIKSDRVDPKVIAKLARLDALPLAYVPSKETSDLREKVRRRTFLEQKGWMLLLTRGISVLSRSKTALTTGSFLMCPSKTGMEMVLSRGRVFLLENSMLISSFMIWGQMRLFVLGEIRLFSAIWIMLIKRTYGFTELMRVSLVSFS